MCNFPQKCLIFWTQSSHPPSNLAEKWFTGSIVFYLGLYFELIVVPVRMLPFSLLRLQVIWLKKFPWLFFGSGGLRLYHHLSQCIALQEFGAFYMKLDKPWKSTSLIKWDMATWGCVFLGLIFIYLFKISLVEAHFSLSVFVTYFGYLNYRGRDTLRN